MSTLSIALLALAAVSGAVAFVLRDDARKARVTGAFSSLRGNQRLVQTFAPVVAAVAAALWVGLPARRVAREAVAERERVERSAVLARQIREGFVPATEAETAEWRRTRAELADFGATQSERLALAHAIARLAGDAGLDRVRVRVVPADSALDVPPRMIAGQQFVPSPNRLRVTANGDLDAAAQLIVALPPSVDVQRVEVADQQAAYVLAVFERVETR